VPASRNLSRNQQVLTTGARRLRRWALVPALVVWPLLAGASCEKSSAKTPEAAPGDVVQAADNAKGGGTAAPAKTDTTPLPGVDVSKLEGKKLESFYKLVGSLTSPCGKAHSLRTSVTSDIACKRAPFAARYVSALLEDGASEDDVKTEYQNKYKQAKTSTFKLDGVPFAGTQGAPITIVEYFDYGCPACQAFKPRLEEVLQQNEPKVVVYYKQYPLTHAHPDSMSAAQAAIAAHAQGKFKEMHDILFAKAPKHRKEDVLGYAKEIGLNIPRFEADYAAAEAKVKAEQAEGDAAGVDSTPTIFFNGRRYEGPAYPRYFALWIEEEIAVNR
jgi:protein-disulfide isomerase